MEVHRHDLFVDVGITPDARGLALLTKSLNAFISATQTAELKVSAAVMTTDDDWDTPRTNVLWTMKGREFCETRETPTKKTKERKMKDRLSGILHRSVTFLMRSAGYIEPMQGMWSHANPGAIPELTQLAVNELATMCAFSRFNSSLNRSLQTETTMRWVDAEKLRVLCPDPVLVLPAPGGGMQRVACKWNVQTLPSVTSHLQFARVTLSCEWDVGPAELLDRTTAILGYHGFKEFKLFDELANMWYLPHVFHAPSDLQKIRDALAADIRVQHRDRVVISHSSVEIYKDGKVEYANTWEAATSTKTSPLKLAAWENTICCTILQQVEVLFPKDQHVRVFGDDKLASRVNEYMNS
jgi:hypothetical protein